MLRGSRTQALRVQHVTTWLESLLSSPETADVINFVGGSGTRPLPRSVVRFATVRGLSRGTVADYVPAFTAVPYGLVSGVATGLLASSASIAARAKFRAVRGSPVLSGRSSIAPW